jgi:hypothetical protein
MKRVFLAMSSLAALVLSAGANVSLDALKGVSSAASPADRSLYSEGRCGVTPKARLNSTCC